MKQRVYGTAAAILAAAVLFSVPVRADVAVSARRAVVLDAGSGRILFEQRGGEPSLIASTTKIMTGLLIAEGHNPEEIVTVPKEAVGIEGSSVHLAEGERCTVEELLYGMMLHSGNDAAAALAIYHSGSTAAFAEDMNRRAKELGLTQTHFENPHGLDGENHRSTALDLARLAACAMENPFFYQVVSSRQAVFGDRVFTNHNKLLWQYPGAVGVKTGYTKAAGRILVSCAQREGRRLIAVTLDAPDDWNDHRHLLEFGFTGFTDAAAAAAGQIFGSVPLVGGGTACAVAAKGLSYPVTDAERLTTRCELPPFVYGPVLAGDRAGTLIVYCNEREIGRVPLVWRDTVWEEA